MKTTGLTLAITGESVEQKKQRKGVEAGTSTLACLRVNGSRRDRTEPF